MTPSPIRSPPVTAPGAGRRRRAPLHIAATVVLAVAAGWLRAEPLGPSSLWLDDAWVALVSKTQGPGDTFLIGLTGPGFAFLLKGLLGAVGFSETAAQFLPFTFSVVAPPLLYLAAVHRGVHVAGALVAAGLLLVSPVHMEYATRVKHYSMDSLLAVGLLWLAWGLVVHPTPRRWGWFSAAGLAAVVMSAGVAPVVVAGFAAGGVAALPRGRSMVAMAALAAAVWTLLAGAWYAVVLRPAITPAIRGYWADRYVVLDGGAGPAVASLGSGLRLLLEGFASVPAVVTGLVLAAGAVVLIRRHPAGLVLLAAPVVVVAGLAIAQLAPLGGGRTDSALYPGLALLAGIVASAAASRWPRIAVGGALCATAGLLLVAPRPQAYPAEDVRPLVAHVEQLWEPGDVLLVYPSTIWSYALYTQRPVAIVADAANAWGFRPQVNDGNVVLLQPSREDPSAYSPAVAQAADASGTVWFLSSHRRPDARVIEQQLSSSGRIPGPSVRRPGARLTRWDERAGRR